MDGVGEAYSNASIQAILSANEEVLNSKVGTLLEKVKYGKSDTLGLDAIPEIVIKEGLSAFDRHLILLTEELAPEERLRLNPRAFSYPVICISDPTDRSAFLKKFLEELGDEQKESKFYDVISSKDAISNWERLGGGPGIITGPTSAITIVRERKVLFTVIVNYLTQHIFVACDKGIAVWKINAADYNIKDVDLSTILSEGQAIEFNIDRSNWTHDDGQNYVTFLGKHLYEQSFNDIGIPFTREDALIAREPGGATRVFYLSNLYKDRPVGFVLANGEKIIEWIHWLAPLMYYSHRPLRAFEISLDRPWTKGGVLMEPSPTYSIFEKEGDNHLLDIRQLLTHSNPSKYRSTILVTYAGNLWAIQMMKSYRQRELSLSF